MCPYCIEGWITYSEFLLKNQKFKTTLKCVKNCISVIEKTEQKEKITFEELKKKILVLNAKALENLDQEDEAK